MPPIQCLFLSVKPTADVRLTFKSKGEDYPPHIPHHVTNVLELHFVSTSILTSKLFSWLTSQQICIKKKKKKKKKFI